MADITTEAEAVAALERAIGKSDLPLPRCYSSGFYIEPQQRVDEWLAWLVRQATSITFETLHEGPNRFGCSFNGDVYQWAGSTLVAGARAYLKQGDS